LSYALLAFVKVTDEASDEAQAVDSGYPRKMRVKCKHTVWSACQEGN